MPRARQSLHLAAVVALILAPTAILASGPAERGERDATHILGERIYLRGIGSSGAPIGATVSGDVNVSGEAFACASCHLRSGHGTSEGTIITPGIHARTLFAPLPRGIPWREPGSLANGDGAWAKPPPWLDAGFLRPAYDRESLARAIRTGIDSGGRPLRTTMPRFALSETDMNALLDHLEQLSRDFSPGVTADEIVFATVIAGEVPAARRTAMLGTLHAFIESRGRDPRNEEKRGRIGPYFHRRMYAAFRRVRLIVWELSGPASAWPAQLDRYYAAEPVFALVGGISAGDWSPIHQFAESRRIPSLLPITDQPPLGPEGWYTLYFSKGLAQEGEGAARWLHHSALERKAGPIVQVYREGGRGALLARGFEQEWRTLGEEPPLSIEVLAHLALDRAVDDALRMKPAALLLWVEEEAGPQLARIASSTQRPGVAVVASGLVGSNLSIIPDSARAFALATFPYALPGSKPGSEAGLARWLQLRSLPRADQRIEGSMYTLGLLLSAALDEMGLNFFREVLLEQFDMMTDQEASSPVYPRLSFGPGQRFSSKGCYIVRVAPGAGAALEPVSGWLAQ